MSIYDENNFNAEWYQFSEKSWKKLNELLNGNEIGIYVIKISDDEPKNFSYEDEIQYIGMTTTSLRKRLKQFYNTFKHGHGHGGALQFIGRYLCPLRKRHIDHNKGNYEFDWKKGETDVLDQFLDKCWFTFSMVKLSGKKSPTIDDNKNKGDVVQAEYYAFAEYQNHHDGKLPLCNQNKADLMDNNDTDGKNRFKCKGKDHKNTGCSGCSL